MPDSDLLPGDVIQVALPRHVPPGREQEGTRPAVVVGVPDWLGTPRYPMLAVVPLTSQYGGWAGRSPHLYPHLPAGTVGLPYDSVALLDHLRGVDADRILDYLGTLTAVEYAPIREGLRRIFDLPEAAEGAGGAEGEPGDTEESAGGPEAEQ